MSPEAQKIAVVYGCALITVALVLGIWLRGPEATLDWILARFDALIGWVTTLEF